MKKSLNSWKKCIFFDFLAVSNLVVSYFVLPRGISAPINTLNPRGHFLTSLYQVHFSRNWNAPETRLNKAFLAHESSPKSSDFALSNEKTLYLNYRKFGIVYFYDFRGQKVTSGVQCIAEWNLVPHSTAQHFLCCAVCCAVFENWI